MARQKKDGIKVTYYLKRDVVDKLEQYSDSTGIPKSVIVEKCIANYLQDSYKNNTEKGK